MKELIQAKNQHIKQLQEQLNQYREDHDYEQNKALKFELMYDAALGQCDAYQSSLAQLMQQQQNNNDQH